MVFLFQNVFLKLWPDREHILSYDTKKNYSPKKFHCDLEISLSNAFKSVFPGANIKYCLWYFLEIWKLIKIFTRNILSF